MFLNVSVCSVTSNMFASELSVCCFFCYFQPHTLYQSYELSELQMNKTIIPGKGSVELSHTCLICTFTFDVGFFFGKLLCYE